MPAGDEAAYAADGGADGRRCAKCGASKFWDADVGEDGSVIEFDEGEEAVIAAGEGGQMGMSERAE